MSDVISQGVAVITGAAGGIGFALAREAVGRGMPVVISDIREDALEEARERLVAANGNVLARLADVTDSGQLEALAEAAVERFGKVNLLVNNAGAFVGGLAWETPDDQFDWVIELNLKSVARGIRAFVPRMIAQGDPCHVVTIASAAAFTVYPGYATYSSTKHAAMALTEALYLDLKAEAIDNIGVTIVMPGMIRTDIMAPEKASPAALGLDREKRHANRTVRTIENVMTGNLDTAMAPGELARRVFAAVAAGNLYCLPNHDSKALVAVGSAIGRGRASGVNPWEPILESILNSMSAADERPD